MQSSPGNGACPRFGSITGNTTQDQNQINLTPETSRYEFPTFARANGILAAVASAESLSVILAADRKYLDVDL